MRRPIPRVVGVCSAAQVGDLVLVLDRTEPIEDSLCPLEPKPGQRRGREIPIAEPERAVESLLEYLNARLR